MRLPLPLTVKQIKAHMAADPDDRQYWEEMLRLASAMADEAEEESEAA
jgi:hypothetical protein